MNRLLLFLICQLNFFSLVKLENEFTFVSVLYSDDFLIPAKVLAHRLKKLNPNIHYNIIVTEEVSYSSIESLKLHGAIIRHDFKIDTPYIKTHLAKKYQYTKIYYWNMTEYDMIVHLDLDTLPIKNITNLFQCGTFCASFRHSDMFNSGVFVLKPNTSIFNDMKNRIKTTFSYDGGDQGFLNSYFDYLKFAPMFDEINITKKSSTWKMKRLSAAFNYDIGVYYLNGGVSFVKPKIIHYTMGPTKPWYWWTYPMLDLNWVWLDARKEMEASENISLTCLPLVFHHIIFLLFLILLKKSAECLFNEMLITDRTSSLESIAMSNIPYLLAISFCLHIVPLNSNPIAAWMFFSSSTAWTTFILSSLYIKIRAGREAFFSRSIGCIIIIILLHLVSWIILSKIRSFSTRLWTCAILLAAQHFLVSLYIKKLYFYPTWTRKWRYQIVPREEA